MERSGVVLVVKNEVEEIACWLAWHRALGFDACIVFDDHSTDGTWELLNRAARTQDVRLSRTVGRRNAHYYERQEESYRTALARHRDEFEWLCFLDGDEYLAFPGGDDLGSFLRRFDDADAVAVNWCNYGSNGHVLKPKLLPIEAYTRHGDEQQSVNRHVKSLVRPAKVGPRWRNVHCFDVAPERYRHADGERVSWGRLPGIMDRPPSWTTAKVMHFQCRSMEHFVERLRRRPELPATMNVWRSLDVNQVEDAAPLALAPRIKELAARITSGHLDEEPQRLCAEACPDGDAYASGAATRAHGSSFRAAVVARLWRGHDPFDMVAGNDPQPDLQGWGSTHAYLTSAHETLKPRMIVEVGAWKGASVVTMAAKQRALGLDGVTVAVDTWLGSWDHWLDERWFAELGREHGYPSLYRKFMNNVVASGLRDYVVPLPLDSLNAAEIVKRAGLTADLIHVDGAHDYDSVIADLRAWWPVLRPGGLLIGDSYYPATHWPGVKQAFDEFFARRVSRPLENASGKCRVWKDA